MWAPARCRLPAGTLRHSRRRLRPVLSSVMGTPYRVYPDFVPPAAAAAARPRNTLGEAKTGLG